MTRRRRGVTLILVMLLAAMAACSWQKIPPPPEYAEPAMFPLVVGLEFGDSPSAQQLDSRIATALRDAETFQYMLWPYNPNTPVDGVLSIAIEGAWSESKTQSVTSAIFVGLTLGLLGPVLGTTTTGVHHVDATFTRGDSTVVAYDYTVETKVKRGVSASKDVTMFQANEVQTKKIVGGLLSRLDADRTKITGVEEKP